VEDKLIIAVSYLSRLAVLLAMIIIVIKISPLETDNIWLTIFGIMSLVMNFTLFCIILYHFLVWLFNSKYN